MNGLSQTNTTAESPWVLHRPKDPATFLSALGVEASRVESLMTHDAHILFPDSSKADSAFEILSAIRINDKKLLYVERNSSDPCRLFYRLDFFDPVNEQTTFQSGDRIVRFQDFFVSIVTRTGKHVPEGELLSNRRLLPQQISNHELYDYLIDIPSTDIAA